MSLLASRAASLKLMMGGRWWMREPHATGRRCKRWEPGGPVLGLQGAITGQAPCVAFDGLSLASLARQSRAPRLQRCWHSCSGALYRFHARGCRIERPIQGAPTHRADVRMGSQPAGQSMRAATLSPLQIDE